MIFFPQNFHVRKISLHLPPSAPPSNSSLYRASFFFFGKARVVVQHTKMSGWGERKGERRIGVGGRGCVGYQVAPTTSNKTSWRGGMPCATYRVWQKFRDFGKKKKRNHHAQSNMQSKSRRNNSTKNLNVLLVETPCICPMCTTTIQLLAHDTHPSSPTLYDSTRT